MLAQSPTKSEQKSNGFALFNLGFRPFFLGAGIFSLLSMTAWILNYTMTLPLTVEAVSPMQWHAHEMLYGYGLAVIAGFLLTAVKNWTGVQTIRGWPLLGLFALWALARLLLLPGTAFISLAAAFDMLFGLLLIVCVAHPIVKAKQWQQLAIISKLIIIVGGNGLFYLGALGFFEDAARLSIYGALYLIISLIMVIGRRVIPFFIERGAREQVRLRQFRSLDFSIMALFVIFFINELFISYAEITFWTTGLLFLFNGFRLYNWHTPGIWRAPLLWGLYVSAWLINIGFLMMAAQHWVTVPAVLTVHLFTIGGIGLMTLAMMSRVALGHSGRNLLRPPTLVGYFLALLVMSAIMRIGLPLIDMNHYLEWVVGSYICWALAFILFISIYAPVLTKPRIDGKPG
jgi:uncharacterized protein involved in response to NO